MSNSNTFSGNNILQCTYGFRFNYPSNNNKIHHNNLITNGYNAWDENEYTNNWDNEEKGNYWADYEEKYPNAKKIWLKGIWNKPYDIPFVNNQDRYPLIFPHIRSNEKTIKIFASFLQKNLESYSFFKQILINKL